MAESFASVAIPVLVMMSADDFDRLTLIRAPWGGTDQSDPLSWANQWEAGRFENLSQGREPDDAPSFEWEQAHWVGDSPSSLILARSYLDAVEVGYEVMWDMDEQGGYVLLTDAVTRG